MSDRIRALRIVNAVFTKDIKGDIGKLARASVPKSDKMDIVSRVEREIRAVRLRDHRFYRAGPIWTWILDRAGFAGVTTPWRSIILHPDHQHDQRLRRHELAHIAQINRDGALTWSFFVAWYVCRYGYRKSPYEIHARAAEGEDNEGN